MNSSEVSTLRQALKIKYIIYFVGEGLRKVFRQPKCIVAALMYLLLFALSVRAVWHAGTFPMITILRIVAVCVAMGSVGAFALWCLGAPKKYLQIMQNMPRVGLHNAVGESPVLLQRMKGPHDLNTEVWVFESHGVPFSAWQEKAEEIESALDVAYITLEALDSRRVMLTVVLHPEPWKTRIDWDQDYLQDGSAVLALGDNRGKTVSVDLGVTPHFLVASRTGGGKTCLMQSLMLQCILKGMAVILVDYKRGVDFTGPWRDHCEIIVDDDPLLDKLDELYAEMLRRLILLDQNECNNIDKYNEAFNAALPRICIFFDEIVECLDKTGATKERKEKLILIEAKLCSIARLGRAAGIHLILASQRGSADVLNGQIRNNVFKLCGPCDDNLSILTLGTSDAARKISFDAVGRFLTENGILFQGYYSDYGPEEFEKR